MRDEMFKYLAPKFGCVEGCILTRRAKALHWLLFPIESLSWRLSDFYGFCPMTNSINIGSKKLSIRELSRITDGRKYTIQFKDGLLHVEIVDGAN